jgi:molybdopterin molybdotransferase
MSTAAPNPIVLSYAQATELVAEQAVQLGRRTPATESVALNHAAGRILAQPLKADRDQPPFVRASRDGYACRAVEAVAHQWLTLAGMSRAGDAPSGPLPALGAWEIMNGAPLPAGADAVAGLDRIEKKAKKIRLLADRALRPGKNLVARGAQARAGEELLPAGIVLRPAQIALAAACGCATVEVFRRPRVAILTTGDELVAVEAVPAPGKIRNSNAPMLAAMVAAAGGELRVLPVVADNAAALNAALAAVLTPAAGVDFLVLSGGLSAGKFDLVKSALAHRGARFHFTGVGIQPGKPTVFGELPRKGLRPLPFVGLAGNPIASAVGFSLFAAPLLAALAGNREPLPRFALARLAAPVPRTGKTSLTRFLPAQCDFGTSSEEPQAAIVPSNGSGDLTALARTNCFAVLPEDTKTLEAGALVRLLLP